MKTLISVIRRTRDKTKFRRLYPTAQSFWFIDISNVVLYYDLRQIINEYDNIHEYW